MPDIDVASVAEAFPEQFGFLKDDKKLAERLKTEGKTMLANELEIVLLNERCNFFRFKNCTVHPIRTVEFNFLGKKDLLDYRICSNKS